MARAFCGDPVIADRLLEIQKELVDLMGEIATEESDLQRHRDRGHRCVDAAMVERLAAQIRHLEKTERISFRNWATPGACRESAVLDLARTACRRAEREVVVLGETGFRVNPETVRYLNRLSDLCWLFARWVETRMGVA